MTAVQASPPTAVATLIQGYLDHLAVERGSSANTLSSYRRDLARYQEYLAEREREALSREARSEARSEAATQQRQAAQARDRQGTGEKEARQRAQTLAALESQIAQAEAALAEYSRQLQESGEAGAFEEIRHLANAYATAQAQLDGLMAEWTALSGERS